MIWPWLCDPDIKAGSALDIIDCHKYLKKNYTYFGEFFSLTDKLSFLEDHSLLGHAHSMSFNIFARFCLRYVSLFVYESPSMMVT